MDEQDKGSEHSDGAAAAQGEGIVTKLSAGSVADTIERLSVILAEKGMTTFAMIDHSGEAAKVGLELRDTKVVIFGNPRAGTGLMEASPLAALDLPLKILVWDDGGATRLSYLSPATFGARYGLSDDLLQPITGIDALTDAVLEP
jgi:uncharacterized protein (DUF302 family)